MCQQRPCWQRAQLPRCSCLVLLPAKRGTVVAPPVAVRWLWTAQGLTVLKGVSVQCQGGGSAGSLLRRPNDEQDNEEPACQLWAFITAAMEYPAMAVADLTAEDDNASAAPYPAPSIRLLMIIPFCVTA